MKSLALITCMLLAFACGGNGDGDAEPESLSPDIQPAVAKLPWHQARSAEGKFLCKVVRVIPQENPQAPDETVVLLEFNIPNAKGVIFDQEVRVPRAIRPDGENCAGPWFMTPLMPTPEGVCIPDLHLGAKVDRIALLQLDALAAHVIDAKEFVFDGLGLGDSKKLRCRAFELVVRGVEDRVDVILESFPEFAEEHAEYHMDIPPTVATHQWGLGALKVFDKMGNRLKLWNAAGGQGGAAGGFCNPATADGSNAPISYPVTVKISIPMRVRTENVVFQFKNIPIAQYERPR